jgi:hypothetical protein
MGWATQAIETLNSGETVQIRPRGQSMTGKVNSGQLCTIAPCVTSELKVGDIVLCKVKSAQYLHLIKAIKNTQFQIGNNRGGINGWITGQNIYGKLIKVED